MWTHQPTEEQILQLCTAHPDMSGYTHTQPQPLPLQPDDTPTPDPRLNRWWQAVTALRPDALLQSPTETLVIEVKAALTPHAIGQALVYTSLYRQANQGAPNPVPAVCCLHAPKALAAIASQHGVRVYTPAGQFRTSSSSASSGPSKPSFARISRPRKSTTR